jgi:hypothetical protein
MRAVRRVLGAAAAVALPPAEAIAVAQAMEALAGHGFRRPRLRVPRLRRGMAQGLASGAALLGSCLPR